MDFSTLSYRELQGHAKQHGIPANKKKEELVRLLTEATAASTTVAPAPEPVAPVVVEVPVVVNEPVKEAEVEEDVFALKVLDNMMEDEEAAVIDEMDELMDGIEGMKLRGLPTPSGKKTIFEDSESDSNEYQCNWGIETPLEPTTAPVNKNVQFFSSPQGKQGNNSHFLPVNSENKKNNQPLLINASTPNKKLLQSAEKNKSAKKEVLMNFWLAKGTPKKGAVY